MNDTDMGANSVRYCTECRMRLAIAGSTQYDRIREAIDRHAEATPEIAAMIEARRGRDGGKKRAGGDKKDGTYQPTKSQSRMTTKYKCGRTISMICYDEEPSENLHNVSPLSRKAIKRVGKSC